MSEMLPGMEMFQPDRPGEADLTAHTFTAALVKKQYPGVYDAIIRGLKLGLPNSAISEVLRVSPQTVAAVKTTGAALFLNERKRALRGSVSNRILESIERETSDQQALDAMPIEKKVSLVERLEALKIGGEDSDGKKKPAEDIIDVESVSAFDDLVNGLNVLNPGENSEQVGITSTSQTPQEQGTSDRLCDSATLHRGGDQAMNNNQQSACQPSGETVVRCSTRSASDDLRSVERSARSGQRPISIGSTDSWGNPWGNSVAAGTSSSHRDIDAEVDTAAAPDAAQAPRGAGEPPSLGTGV